MGLEHTLQKAKTTRLKTYEEAYRYQRQRVIPGKAITEKLRRATEYDIKENGARAYGFKKQKQ